MYDAVIISDLHLGASNCQVESLLNLLDNIKDKTKVLILNGDVLDSLNFYRLSKDHWKILSKIRKLSKEINIIWCKGNHDCFPEVISNLLGCEVVSEYIFKVNDKVIIVIHGHVFDDFLDDHPLLTWIGDIAYGFLQRIDKSHEWARWAKHSSKTFLRCIEAVKERAVAYALNKDADIIICGHTHSSEYCLSELGVEYYNSGCWTEKPCSYIVIENDIIEIRYII